MPELSHANWCTAKERCSCQPGGTGDAVLVVDDELSVARVYAEQLMRAGFKVDLATSTHQAVHLLSFSQYHAILADILIDQDSGFDLLQYCQKQYPGLPIILVTGMPSTDGAIMALRLGAFDYLRKPVSKEELLLTMQAAVEQCKLRQQNRMYAEEVNSYRQNLEEIVANRTRSLAENRDFLKSILEALPHPFCVIDVKTHRVLMANSAAKARGENSGETCHQLFHGRSAPCDQTHHACPLVEVIASQKPIVVEHMHTDATGSTRRDEIHGYPICDSTGTITRMIQYKIDVTERRQLESIAESASLMENLGYIFAGIRHEIGNPINSIKVSLTVLEKKLPGYSLDTIAEFLKRTLDEVARVEDLLKSFKRFSLHERASMITLDVTEFLKKFVEFARNELGRRGLEIELIAENLPCPIKADVTFLQQVMLNLTTNAAQALESQPQPKISIQLLREQGMVTIAVSDNGCGMTEEDCRKAFLPFFTTKPRGTGLGLVIVQKILLKMKGSLHLASQLGKGTTATVRLPEGPHGS